MPCLDVKMRYKVIFIETVALIQVHVRLLHNIHVIIMQSWLWPPPDNTCTCINFSSATFFLNIMSVHVK